MANILIVDDSRDILEVMQSVLEIDGHEVRCATGKSQMIFALTEFKPDIIIIDIILNGDNGRDVCKELKANEDTKDIPVMLMSASPALLNDHKECGAADVISKPFHLSDLTDKITSLLKLLPLFIINLHDVSHSFIRHF
jgi:DNA-binding response OmpR family regulator